MRKLIPLFVSLVVLSYQGRQADAAEWSINGSGCVVDSIGLLAGLANQQVGVVQFQTGKTGTILLHCPITPGNGDVEGTGFGMEVYFSDGDGTSAGSTVTAEVKRMSFATGVISSVGCTMNSNTDGANTTSYQHILKSCAAHNFDRNAYLYFVMVNVTRNSTAHVTSFAGLSL